MGFRNPLRTAAAVDTGQPAGAGVRTYQQATATGTRGVVEFRDGIAGDAPSVLTAQANLVPQGGGGYTAQGGYAELDAGSWNSIDGPALRLAVAEAPGGGYRSEASIVGADVVLIKGLPIPVASVTERNALTKYDGLMVQRLDTPDRRIETWAGTPSTGKWCFRIEGTISNSANTDANGFLSWAHGGGQAPLQWGLSLRAQATDPINVTLDFVAWAADATNLQLRAVNNAQASYWPGISVNFYWWAKF